MPERITYTTVDDVQIVGSWETAPTTVGAVILLHMLPAARDSWQPFQHVLSQRGLASLAIDLRGHGESTRGPESATLDYKKFSDGEHASSIEDVRGAYQWIRSRGVERSRIAVVGASIGANLALRFLADEPQVLAAGLLSPGENYHGVTTLDMVPNVLPHQSVWIAASVGDDDEAVRAADAIDQALVVDHHVFEKKQGAGHGTHLFEADPDLMQTLADWLRDRLLAVET